MGFEKAWKTAEQEGVHVFSAFGERNRGLMGFIPFNPLLSALSTSPHELLQRFLVVPDGISVMNFSSWAMNEAECVTNFAFWFGLCPSQQRKAEESRERGMPNRRQTE